MQLVGSFKVRPGAGCYRLMVAGLLGAAVALPAIAGRFEATEVDVQLVLASDVSGSMSRDELRLQRDGYVAALRGRAVADALTSGALGRIALTYVEWAGLDEQAVVVPWTVVASEHDLDDFANRLAEGPRLVTGWSPTFLRGPGTSISDALLFAAARFDESGVHSFGRTIDISGDGPNNEGPDIAIARDAIVARGITINAIAIALPDRDIYGPYGDMFGITYESLRPYYEDNVIGGPGAFAMGVAGLDDFAETLQRKLVMEISAVRPSRTLGVSSLATSANDCLLRSGEHARPSHDIPSIQGQIRDFSDLAEHLLGKCPPAGRQRAKIEMKRGALVHVRSWRWADQFKRQHQVRF